MKVDRDGGGERLVMRKNDLPFYHCIINVIVFNPRVCDEWLALKRLVGEFVFSLVAAP